MNKRYNCSLFFAIVFFVAIISCNEKRIIPNQADFSDVDSIIYDYSDKENIIPRDSVFGKISFIALETVDDNLIGMVDQVLFGDSTIIIVDRMIANGVFLFDMEGKYVGRMSRLGNGHNEFRRLSYVSKRPDNNFAVFDELSNNIMIFDERGKHIETIKSDMFSSAMEFIGQDHIAFNIFARYPDFYEPYYGASFVIKGLDMKLKYLFGHPGFDNHFNYTRYYNLYSFNDIVYCNVNFEDVIYELGVDSVKAKYRIIYGPDNVNNHQYKTKEEYYALMELYPFFEGEFIELDDYTYLMFRGENGRELFYKHSTKETLALSSGYNNPMISFFRRPLARYGDKTMVCALPVSEALYCKNILMQTSPDDKNVTELFSSISVDSNPILFFFDVVF